jgi:peptidoglycan lytic transglycosylase
MSEDASRLTRRFVMRWPEILWSLRRVSLRLNGRGALVGIGACLVVAVAACTTQTESPPAPMPRSVAQPPPALTAPAQPAPPETSARASKTVKASYQGSGAAGHPTASGEPYNPNGLTAASRTLPIGSTVKVTNPATGKSVKVTINDRGPFVHGRSLDLSKRAAEKIGITHKGVAKLKVTPVKSPSASSESAAPVPAAPAAGTN